VGRWRSSAAGVAVGELRARDWGGSSVLSSRRCGEAGRPTQLLAGPTEGMGEEGDGLPERKTTAVLPQIGLGRGRRVVAKAGAGKEVLGVTFL
jgi:hypothetical protein